MSNTVPTRVTRVDGVQTTVHKKVQETNASSVERVSKLSQNSSEKKEKRTVIKPPKYLPRDMEDDVIEIGASNESGLQTVYLNGRDIGRLSSDEERQYSQIAGSRLVSPGAVRKVWRVSGSTPAMDGVNPKYYSDHDFTRANALYSYAQVFKRYLTRFEQAKEYIENGGIYFDLENGKCIVSGKAELSLDSEYGIRVEVHRDPGFANSRLIVRPSRESQLMATLNFDTPSNAVVYLGRDSNYQGRYKSFVLDEEFNLTLNERDNLDDIDDTEREFIDKVRFVVKEANRLNQ